MTIRSELCSRVRRWTRAPLASLLSVGVLAACDRGDPQAATARPMPAQSAAAPHAPAIVPATTPMPITVYKTPTCGCCASWVDHLRANGFAVTVVDRDDLTDIKSRFGVRDDLASCHTAVVGDYVVEGHVPAADVRRLLAERPAAVGIAVPGMPVGAPGMEMPGTPADRYDVVSFDGGGATGVFSSH